MGTFKYSLWKKPTAIISIKHKCGTKFSRKHDNSLIFLKQNTHITPCNAYAAPIIYDRIFLTTNSACFQFADHSMRKYPENQTMLHHTIPTSLVISMHSGPTKAHSMLPRWLAIPIGRLSRCLLDSYFCRFGLKNYMTSYRHNILPLIKIKNYY